MKSAVVYLVALSLFSFIIPSKVGSLKIDGLFYDDYGYEVKDLYVEVIDTKTNQIIDDFEFKRNFNYEMPLNQHYLFQFHKDGFVSKKFDVCTNDCPTNKHSFEFDMLMLAIPQNKVSDVVHIGHVSYLEKKKMFFNTPKETKALQKKAIMEKFSQYSEE